MFNRFPIPVMRARDRAGSISSLPGAGTLTVPSSAVLAGIGSPLSAPVGMGVAASTPVSQSHSPLASALPSPEFHGDPSRQPRSPSSSSPFHPGVAGPNGKLLQPQSGRLAPSVNYVKLLPSFSRHVSPHGSPTTNATAASAAVAGDEPPASKRHQSSSGASIASPLSSPNSVLAALHPSLTMLSLDAESGVQRPESLPAPPQAMMRLSVNGGQQINGGASLAPSPSSSPAPTAPHNQYTSAAMEG
jgi:hypothetical protein